MVQLFFQSSLPRAGSTMLQNIIGQNPDFYVTPTDGLLELVVGAQVNYTNSPEFRAQDAQTMKNAFVAFCKAGISAYCESISTKPYHLNKSRGWGIYRPMLKAIMGGEPKVVCMVRDLRDVFGSMEKNHRKNPEKSSPMLNWAEMRGTTVEKRVDMWAQGQPIGIAIERLSDIIRMGIDKDVLFVKYEDLCLRPETEMRRIYQYFGIPEFEHDFENIQQITKEDDDVYGYSGLHEVRPSLKMKPSDAKAVLGNHAWNWIYDNYKWFYEYFGYRK